jgi:hypothetical protein
VEQSRFKKQEATMAKTHEPNIDDRCACCEAAIARLESSVRMLGDMVDELSVLVGTLLPPPIIPHDPEKQ